MDYPHQSHDRRHRSMMGALFFFLFSLYMLTYNGELAFNDELQMVNTTASYVEFGDSKYDLALWYVWTNYGPLGTLIPELYPLPESPIEPMQSMVGVPFYWLASQSGLGVIHLMWLVNVFVVIATCVLFFRYVLLLGYKADVALFAALMLGVCTVLWAYTRTFYREPLTLLMVLLFGYLLELGRQKRIWYAHPLAILALITAFFTKNSVIMLLPGLMIIALPNFPHLTNNSSFLRVLYVGLIALLLLPLVLIYTDIAVSTLPEFTLLFGGYAIMPSFSQTALHSYLLSIGGSIWGTSPVLLAAVPGAWLLIRNRRQRYMWVAVVALLGIAIGHAFTTGQHWAGGVSWPPRFLMPAIPFLLICALPMFKKALEKPHNRWWVGGLAILVLYSLWWQVSAAALSWFEYPHALPPEAFFISEWSPGLNTVRYMRPVVLTPLLFELPLDFVWVRMGLIFWPVIFSIALVASGLLLRGRLSERVVCTLTVITPLLLIAGTVAGMVAIDGDAKYLGDKDSLHQISEIIDRETRDEDIVLLNTPDYHLFFVNYRNFGDARLVTLPVPPGERGSFEEAPEVIFDDPVELLDPSASALIESLAQSRERLWLLMNTSPFFPWSIRPTEYYMVTRHYPLRELQTDPADPTVRLLEYVTIPLAIQQSGQATPIETNLQYGDAIKLVEIELPVGTMYQPGEALPISLHWQTEMPLEESYTVALFFANEDRAVLVQGQDSVPVGGFEPTTQWQPNAIVRDNRALRLPDDLATGAYQLWVRLYTTTEDGQLEILPVQGATVYDGNIGVLPVTIHVE